MFLAAVVRFCLTLSVVSIGFSGQVGWELTVLFFMGDLLCSYVAVGVTEKT